MKTKSFQEYLEQRLSKEEIEELECLATKEFEKVIAEDDTVTLYNSVITP